MDATAATRISMCLTHVQKRENVNIRFRCHLYTYPISPFSCEGSIKVTTAVVVVSLEGLAGGRIIPEGSADDIHKNTK